MKRAAHIASLVAIPLAILALCLVQLALGCATGTSGWSFASKPNYLAANLALIALPFFILMAATGRIWAASLGCSILYTLLSVANCYTVALHGAPLCLSELRNAGTALAVLGGYDLGPTPVIWQVIGLGLLAAALSAAARVLEKRQDAQRPRTRRIAGATLLAALLGACWAAGLAPSELAKTHGYIGWSRVESAREHGYPFFIAADAAISTHPYLEPEGYDVAAAQRYAESLEPAQGQAAANDDTASVPDIVVILNETFFDVEAYAGLETDRSALDAFRGIRGAAYGTTIVPLRGGGTNDTEFELLTSHSMRLLATSAPFNYVDFNTCGHTDVRYLQSLGYRTEAFHVGDPQNYNRESAYPAMGFDDMLLGSGNFPECEMYGNRIWSDSGLYDQALRQLDDNDGRPQFLFVLTYQNHGGWNQNDAALDTVHVKDGKGVSEDELDEYLTSIAQSGGEFADFIDALGKRDRPTAVFMMGDHAPSFIDRLQLREGAPLPESLMPLGTPCVAWSNCGLDLSAFDGRTISATDAIPLLAHAAGLPESPYLQAIVDIDGKYPVRTSSGSFLDAAGTVGRLAEDADAMASAAPCYTMEYNALEHGADYRESWFTHGNEQGVGAGVQIR